MERNLIFLISTPRAGSTMLMRILNATSSIVSRPEPHLMPALAHLGFWESVDNAPYDQLQAQAAMRELVKEFPNKDADYYSACRAYSDSLYKNMFDLSIPDDGSSVQYFLDKTPANALVLPFLKKVYPNAKYIFLTRHPGAIFASYANSFFDGDYKAAVDFNPILSRYIPAMAKELQEPSVPILHVSYEEIVTNPEEMLQRLTDFLEVPYEPEALEYKRVKVADGLGDPLGVAKHDRPVTSSMDKWVLELASDKRKFQIVAQQLAEIDPAHLNAWGTPKEELWNGMESADPTLFKVRKKEWSRYTFTRKVLIWLRRDIHNRFHGRLVKKIRFICDVLLRG